MKKISKKRLCSTLVLLLITTITATAQNCNTNLPNGYSSILCQDFETNQKAADYLGNDVWYFYWGGNSVSSNNHPELDKRFKITQDPKNSSNKTIELIKFNGDQDYSGNGLNPRTELSYRPSMERSTDKEIYFHIRTLFPDDQAAIFSAEFIQFWLHGSTNIPLQIEVRNGKFSARIPRNGGYQSYIQGKNLSDYLGKWITWEVEAKFNNNGGYWKIYMDKELVHTHSASISSWPGNNGTWHPQYGVYTNNGGAGTQRALFDDLIIAEFTGVTNSEITNLQLINPLNDEIIDGYENLTQINNIYKAGLSISNFNVYAETSGSIDSVVFLHTYNGITERRKEGNAPYALRGDGAGYSPWSLPNGEHEITATAYYNGIPTETKRAKFTVSDDSIVLTPIDDAYLEGSTRFNTQDLRVEAGNRVAYLKFDLSSIKGAITTAELSLDVGSDAGNGTLVLEAGNSNNWTEENLSTTNAPVAERTIGSMNANYSLGTSHIFDVSNFITSNGVYSFILSIENGGNDVSFASSESLYPPKLTLTVDNTITGNANEVSSPLTIVYPNPTYGKIMVDGAKDAQRIQLQSPQGDAVELKMDSENSLDLSELPSGIYLLTIEYGLSTYHQKIIKQ